MGRGTKPGAVWALWALLVLIALPAVSEAAGAAGPTARAALVMDASTGEVLWERNASDPLPPASTTKVMTAILALESGQLDERYRVSLNASQVAPSKINLRPGQRMVLRDLVYATLLNSANDAATVIAEGLAGSEEAFAVRMNAKARAIGATTAHFTNPHGLTAPGHLASARDLAEIFRYGLRMPLFRDVLSTRALRVPLESPGVQYVSLRSHNRLLTGYAYPVIGKTGYTRPAGRCFVGSAEHDGREIVIVVLGASDLWGDAKRLFAIGFGAAPDRPPLLVAEASPRRGTPRAQGAAQSSEGDLEVPADDVRTLFHYWLQLGPYRSRDAATATRRRLVGRGYAAELVGRRVRVGAYASRTQARRAARRLLAAGYQPTIVALR